jgi:hypothetical protein
MILGSIIDICFWETLSTFIFELKRLRFHSLDTLCVIKFKALALLF